MKLLKTIFNSQSSWYVSFYIDQLNNIHQAAYRPPDNNTLPGHRDPIEPLLKGFTQITSKTIKPYLEHMSKYYNYKQKITHVYVDPSGMLRTLNPQKNETI